MTDNDERMQRDAQLAVAYLEHTKSDLAAIADPMQHATVQFCRVQAIAFFGNYMNRQNGVFLALAEAQRLAQQPPAEKS